MANFWSDEHDLLWVPLVCTMVVVIIFEALLRPKLTSMSVDIMEHCHLEVLKDTAKNCWTNMGVTAALLLTVDGAMLQSDAMQPRFAMDGVDEEKLLQLQLTYDFLSAIALIYCIWSLLQCVICLCYLEPMDNTACIKFFIANPASIGGPALSIILACVHTTIALVLWVLGTSGLVNAIGCGVFAGVILIVLLFEIWDKAGFDPSGRTKKAAEWQWTMKDPSEWPWFVQKYKKDEKATRVFKRMGKAIIEAELMGDRCDQPKSDASVCVVPCAR